MKLILAAFALMGLSIPKAWGQAGHSAKGMALPLRIAYRPNGVGAVLTWPMDPVYSGKAMISWRRVADGGDFHTPRADSTTEGIQFLTDSTALDTNIRTGDLIEYQVMCHEEGAGLNIRKTGVLAACNDCPAAGHRGTILLVVESGLMDSIQTDCAILINDLKADGWLVKTITAARTDSVAWVKRRITSAYRQNPTEVKMLYLLGQVPVPYTGDIFPDGHPDHRGAWPSDGIYADVDAFADRQVMSIYSTRQENWNFLRDGKYDASTYSGRTIELGVGRVSMFYLPQFSSFNRKWNESFLTRRYLRKAHLYKMGEIWNNGTGLMDDNFGYFGGEAFAASGWMNMYANLGQRKATAGDYVGAGKVSNWMMAYGDGGGDYQNCLDVVRGSNYVRDSINTLFTQLFGSYFGDWDSMDNLLRSAIANKGQILTSSWSGRPWQYYHRMGAGMPYGYTAQLNLNLNGLYTPSYDSEVSNEFLGDPSLRMHYFRPPTSARAMQAGNRVVKIEWTPSRDSVEGYFVYRALTDTSAYELVTPRPIRDTVYRDTLATIGEYHYMVRAALHQAWPGGRYFNQSLGSLTGVVQVVTGAPARLLPSLTIQPNPTQGRVEVKSSAEISSIQVLDGMGRAVHLSEGAGRQVSVDLSGLPQGVYSLRICTGEDWQVRRVVRI